MNCKIGSRLAALCIACALALAPTIAAAATEANWARNGEADLLQYRVYTCLVKGCTAVKGATAAAVIPQTASGVRPKWDLPQGAEGALAVTAVDTSNNESGASVSVPFDTAPPAIPTDVQLK